MTDCKLMQQTRNRFVQTSESNGMDVSGRVYKITYNYRSILLLREIRDR